MTIEVLTLQGKHVRLELLGHQHVEGLVAASAADPSLYQWSPVPQGKVEATRYINTALAWRDAGSAVPFAIVRGNDGAVIGSTRFWNLERWDWPEGHPMHGRAVPVGAISDPNSGQHRSQVAHADPGVRCMASAPRVFSHRCAQLSLPGGA
jgi:hypothetical protein